MNKRFTYSLTRLHDNSTWIGQPLQDNTYKYDNAGNIINIDDNGLNTRSQYFEYDNVNRLIHSKGGMNCQGMGIGYETDYIYSAAGRILKKNVTSQRMNTTAGVYPVDYRNSYAYPSSGNVFAAKDVREAITGSVTHFDWDANGNLIRSVCGSPVHDRHLCWTEDRCGGQMDTERRAELLRIQKNTSRWTRCTNSSKSALCQQPHYMTLKRWTTCWMSLTAVCQFMRIRPTSDNATCWRNGE